MLPNTDEDGEEIEEDDEYEEEMNAFEEAKEPVGVEDYTAWAAMSEEHAADIDMKNTHDGTIP